MTKSSVDLSSKEDLATSEETEKPDSSGLYSPSGSTPQGASVKIIAQKLRTKKAQGGFGAIIATFFLIIFTFGIFTNSYQLVGIKEAYTENIGGVQHNIIRKRSNLLYSKGFFFSEDGAFDGWKSRGKITSVFKNYKTNQLIGDLRKSGLDIVPEKVNGTFTGNIGSIFKDGEEIFNIRDIEDFKQSLEAGRTVLNTALEEQYPSRGRSWRSRATRDLYRRYNLSLNNWLTGKLSSTKIGQAVNGFELKFTKALREKMFGTKDNTVNLSAQTADDSAGDNATDTLTDAEKQLDDISEAAARQSDELLEDATKVVARESVEEIAEEIAKGTAKSAASGAVNLLDNADRVCAVKRVGDAVAVGSRILRSAQLMKYALALFTIADAVKAGDATGEEVGAVMNYLSRPNPDTGKNFFSSGAWRLVSGDKTAVISQDNLSKYSVSGGLSGFFQAAMFKINSAFGGTGKTSCKVIGNMGVQIAGGAVSVALAFGTGGGSVLVGAAIGATLGVAVSFIEVIAKPILTTLVAGTIINGGEYSDESATALYAGASVLNQKNNSNFGMGVMTIPEAKTAYAEYENYLAEQRSKESLYEKYLSFENPRSIRSRMNFATYAYTGTGISGVFKGMAKIFDFSSLRSVFGSLSQIPFGSANAQTDNSIQPCLWDEEIACNAVGVAITGESPSVINTLDPIKNLKWMVEKDYMNGDGAPIAGSEYAEYIKDCFGAADPYFDDDGIPTARCYEDGPNSIYTKFRIAHIDWNLAQDISEDINREYRNTVSGPVAPDAPETSILSPPNLGPVQSDGYYRMPTVSLNNAYMWNTGGTPERSRCGSKTLIDVIYTVAQRWQEVDRNNRVRVGDLNEAEGHATHENGTNVDIFMEKNVAINKGLAETITFATTEDAIKMGRFFADTNVIKSILYNDPDVIADFNSYVKENGLNGKMKFLDGHYNHFHVTILDEYRGVRSGKCIN